MLFISSTLAKALFWVPNLFLANFLALFSPEFLIKSTTLLSYGAKPATSLIKDLTKVVLLDLEPFLYDCLGATALASTL